MKKIFIVLVSLCSLIGLDRMTKILAVEHLKAHDSISYLGGLFQLTYHENSGAMLSMGANLPDESRFYIFTLTVGLALLGGLVYIFIKPLSKLDLVFALLIVGGGLGNLYDRAFNNGQVVDFMLMVVGPIRTGVFNLADVSIMIGTICLAIFNLKWSSQLRARSKATSEDGRP